MNQTPQQKRALDRLFQLFVDTRMLNDTEAIRLMIMYEFDEGDLLVAYGINKAILLTKTHKLIEDWKRK